MRNNRLRELLDADLPSLGTHIHSSWPSITELVGHSGMFDYVEFVAEYAPYDLYALENLGRAIDLFPHMSGMMKIEQEPRTYLTIRAIGSGIQNVLFADPRTVEDVQECVRAVRAETPSNGGIHGVGMRRDVRFVVEGGSPAFAEALDQSVVALMIEKKSAVDNLEALLSVPGVDMTQFGPADFSNSIDRPGEWQHPEVIEAEKHVIETSLKMGVAPRAEINTPEQAERYLEMGVKHFCIGTDVSILFDWFRDTGGAFNELLGRDAPGASGQHGGYGGAGD
ncbi:MAG TPA: 2,4-dihydroxyhept-2-ene-1,7-dioic acid aldolase [Planctomycetaceae bacterium]|jgi:2-keto-3-deoxy-L-rhamnonate aldolase RhmA|nr:2,4-dihydroxyhept-2-ene-1,7-dioic acid aldolase [Planctomycetaceae bacterium]|tara:strand:+ start:3564 stop:4406 length:843 start_codon:yes stop_codon:yes gene_type:complete